MVCKPGSESDMASASIPCQIQGPTVGDSVFGIPGEQGKGSIQCISWHKSALHVSATDCGFEPSLLRRAEPNGLAPSCNGSQ